MFHKVLIFNNKGKLKNLLTRKMLSERHWDLFEDDSKLNPKKNKDPRVRSKKQRYYDIDVESLEF